MPKKSDLEIIILNYNTVFWLKKCLTSLKSQYLDHSKFKIKVTVVDNNSSDESVQTVKDHFSWVNLIELDDNYGFAGGNNRALEKTNAKYVMLLNSDVELTAQSNFDVLLEYMNDNKEVAVVTPRIELTNGGIDPASHRGEPTLWASFTYFAKLEKLFPYSKKFAQYHQTYKNLYSVHEVDACSGASMIVRTEHMDEVGLLDEQFFMYAEDLDWCRRFREAGHSIIYNPEVRVIHHKYKSGIKNTSQKIATKTKHYFYDTMLQYYDKYYAEQYPRLVRVFVKYILEIKKGT